MSYYEIATLALTAISVIGWPTLGYMVGLQSKLSGEISKSLHHRVSEVHDIVKHLDECMDSLKVEVAGKMVTEAQLAQHRMEMQEMITRVRTAISQDTNGLHERLLRLEAPYFTPTPHVGE